VGVPKKTHRVFWVRTRVSEPWTCQCWHLWIGLFSACLFGWHVIVSVVHALSNFNLYDDAVHESVDDFDELSDAISDPTTL